MTRAPRSPRLGFADIDEIAAVLRRAGGRFSAPRRAVLEALFAADGPVSAEYIANGLEGRAPRLDLTSVYRALEYLEELGAVRHVHIGHGPGLYALSDADDREYLACERCSRVTAVESVRLDPVRAQIRRLFGYRARFSHFPIVGLCEHCAASDASRHGHPHTEHPHGHRHEHPAGHGYSGHEHQHSHGDRVHSHAHEAGVEEDHTHPH